MGKRKRPPSPPSPDFRDDSRTTRTGKQFSPFTLEPLFVTTPFSARQYIQALASAESDDDDDDGGGSGIPSNSEIEQESDGDSTLTSLSSQCGSTDSDSEDAIPTPPRASQPPPEYKGKNRVSTLRKRANRRVARAAANRDAKACILDRRLQACKAALPASIAYDADFEPITTAPRWTALRESRKSQDRREYSLEELMSEGSDFQVVGWNGRDCRPIVDSEDVVFAILGGAPRDKDWEGVAADAAQAFEEAHRKMKVEDKHIHHRRGDFPALAAGISHGGGQREPMVLDHSRRNRRALARLFRQKAIRRISGYTNCILRTYARRLHTYYSNTLVKLCDKSPDLAPPIRGSKFAACSVNLGPRTVSFPHRDFANLTWGWCSITALGSFNPDLGGHLVLWDLKLIVRFPPGSTILIPSAMIKHSNTSIGDGEVRYSLAQYSAGGLFRWVANGCQSQKSWEQKATPKALRERREDTEMRWAHGLGMLSTLAELQSLQA